ncbi:MAG: hypothetical protein A2X49_06270 [Lentisphaerae bacterium GWF2_52_8]|nr:MAG: hypothetical protein A2X49_06270 [Lentisphaerae bacterium GWF2_52_8]
MSIKKVLTGSVSEHASSDIRTAARREWDNDFYAFFRESLDRYISRENDSTKSAYHPYQCRYSFHNPSSYYSIAAGLWLAVSYVLKKQLIAFSMSFYNSIGFLIYKIYFSD